MKRLPIVLLLAMMTAGCEANNGGTTTILRTVMDEEWPLTIERGYLPCDCVERELPFFQCAKSALTIRDPTERVTYSVNDVHVPSVIRAKSIEPIRRADSENPSGKVDLGPLIERGLKLCPS